MLSFNKLTSILETTIKWEQQMKDLYDVAELGLKTKESKDLLSFLKESHLKHLKILQNLDVKDYGPDGWVRFTADFDVLHHIPQHQITKDSTVEEIFSKVKSYEESLQSFYMEVSEHTVSESQKALFSSLALMKRNTITAIKNFMEKYISPIQG